MERASGLTNGRRLGRLHRIRSRPMLAYVAIAYLVSWTIASLLIADAVPPSFHLLVAAGPTVGAILVTAAVADRAGIAALHSDSSPSA
jgi:hypothetical protein